MCPSDVTLEVDMGRSGPRTDMDAMLVADGRTLVVVSSDAGTATLSVPAPRRPSSELSPPLPLPLLLAALRLLLLPMLLVVAVVTLTPVDRA